MDISSFSNRSGAAMTSNSTIFPSRTLQRRATVPAPSEDGITLSASIVAGADGGPAVRFSLRNTDKQAVTVLTGISTGSTPRPAEAFSFTLIFADGHKTQLFCASSLCPPPIIAGAISPYIIHLLPGQ